MKVSKSTRLCSAHFAPGCTVPYVKSPSLVKPKKQPRHTLIRKSIKDRSDYYKEVPSLSQLCATDIKINLAKSVQYEHYKAELLQQEVSCNTLSNNLSQSVQQVVTLMKENSLLHSQQSSSAGRIASLEAELSRLSLQNRCLQEKVEVYEHHRYRLRAENLENNDSEIHFYTGITSWNSFLLFFQSLQVYNLENLQYVGCERTFPPGSKRGPPRTLTPLNEFF